VDHGSQSAGHDLAVRVARLLAHCCECEPDQQYSAANRHSYTDDTREAGEDFGILGGEAFPWRRA